MIPEAILEPVTDIFVAGEAFSPGKFTFLPGKPLVGAVCEMDINKYDGDSEDAEIEKTEEWLSPGAASEHSVQIFQSHVLTKHGKFLYNEELADYSDSVMYVEDKGLAVNVTVGLGCQATVQTGGVLEDVRLCANGAGQGSLNVYARGMVIGADISGTAQLFNGGVLEDGTVRDGGALMLFMGSTATAVNVQAGGYLYGKENSCLHSLVASSGSRLNVSNCRLDNVVLQGGAQLSLDGCVLQDCTLFGALSGTPGKNIAALGTLTVAGSVTGWETVDLSGTAISFRLAERTAENAPFFSLWASGNAPLSCGAVVASEQVSGAYRLFGDAEGFNQSLRLSLDGTGASIGSLDTGDVLEKETVRYGLELCETGLALTISNRQKLIVARGTMHTDLEGGWWDEAPVLAVHARSAKASVKSADWFSAEGFAVTPEEIAVAEGPARIVAQKDGKADVFLADASGVWDADYCAENTFTGARASMAGKNRFYDVFVGSEAETSVLMLTDDADALFADDIFSAFAESQENRQQRLSEIHAGAGNDLIDLTCRNVTSESAPCLLDGGDGNDILWGGAQASVIIGGKGDDTLVSHREGVLFLFEAEWGRDTVQVGDGLDFGLRFAEGTQLSISYNDFGARLECGNSCVAVQGVFERIEERISYGVLCA